MSIGVCIPQLLEQGKLTPEQAAQAEGLFAELADGWQQASEMLRQRFNAAGGDIGKLDNWGLPQSHDARLVRAAGKEAWLAEIRPRLNREAMIDQRTGKPFTEQALEIELDAVFETIWAIRDCL